MVFLFINGLRQLYAPHREAHHFKRLAVCQIALPLVDAAALLAQVDQFEQIGVEAGLPHHALEERLVRTVATRGDHHSVESVALNVFLDGSQRFGKTGEAQGISRFHAGEMACLLNERGIVEMFAKRVSAIASKDAYARRLTAYVA